VNHCLKRLRIVLQCNLLYYLIVLFIIIYISLFVVTYKVKHVYDFNNKVFNIRINNYEVDGNKLKINTNNLVCFYYFNTLNEKIEFINDYSLGDTIMVYGTLKIPNNNTIPNTFNYKKYLYYNDIEYILIIKNFYKIKDNKNIFYNIKNNIYKRINNINHNEYIYAYILGNTSYIDNNIYNRYKENGITHLFAVSALHITMFSNIIFTILRKFKINYNTSFIIVFLLLFFYSFIVDFSPSVLRAFIFFSLNKIFKILNIKTNKTNILILTIFIILLINPKNIYNNGFILSIVISLFIIIYKTYNKLSLFKINIISFLSSLPIIINNYYEFNLLSIFNNMIFIPFISSIVFPFSIIAFIIPKLSFILKILTNILEIISSVCSNVLTINIIIRKLNIIEIIIYYLLLILFIKKDKKYIYILLLLIIIIYINPIQNDSVIFFDVNQGDSSLIIVDKQSILVDTGGIIKKEVEEWEKHSIENNIYTSLITYFKSIGLRNLDYLIISHGDYDHMGEAINLVNNFIVEKVIFNCGPYNDLEKELIKVLNKKKILYYSCVKELNVDNNKLHFLQTKEYDNENDNSNVIYTELNGYKFMFMGDASINTEKEILDKYNLPNIDILKVGHHGSKTSSGKEFINEINPKYVIISVGKNNRYGHPNKEVLDNLKKSKKYRTDEDGSIMFKIINNNLKMETYSP